jgi:TctA family transporter
MSPAGDVPAAPMTRFFTPVVGLIAWAIQFTVVYGFAAVACARDYARLTVFGIGVVPLVILTTTAGALALTAWSLLVGLRRQQHIDESQATDRFLTNATILISGFSLVVIAWHGLPALIVPVCP